MVFQDAVQNCLTGFCDRERIRHSTRGVLGVLFGGNFDERHRATVVEDGIPGQLAHLGRIQHVVDGNGFLRTGLTHHQTELLVVVVAELDNIAVQLAGSGVDIGKLQAWGALTILEETLLLVCVRGLT